VTEPEYTRKLITIIEAEERQKLKKKKEGGVPPPYQALLSERELEVLRLMAEGLSNQQIADRLIISLSTAKNHVHNIVDVEVNTHTPSAEEAAAIYPGYLESLRASQPQTAKAGPDLNNLTIEEVMSMYPGVLELIDVSQLQTGDSD